MNKIDGIIQDYSDKTHDRITKSLYRNSAISPEIQPLENVPSGSLVSEEIHSVEHSSRIPDGLNSRIPVNSIATAGPMTAEFGGGSVGGHAQSDSEHMERHE